MGRVPCCDSKDGLKKGPWLPEEDQKLIDYIEKHGPGNWRSLPKKAGLQRCGKSCRLRWTNYLRPDIKRGKFSFEEEETIIQLHSVLGNKWSAIAAKLPGRTDNEIKNYWNTHIRKRLLRMGIDPVTHTRRLDLIHHLPFPSNDQLNLLNLLSLQTLMNPDILSLATLLSTTQNHNLFNNLQPNNSTTHNNAANQIQNNQFNPISQTLHNNVGSISVSNSGYNTFLCNDQVTKQTNFHNIPSFDTQSCINQMQNNEGFVQVCNNDLNFDYNQQDLMENLLENSMENPSWKSYNNNSNDQITFLPSMLSSPSSRSEEEEENETDSYCQKLMNFDIPAELFDVCKS